MSSSSVHPHPLAASYSRFAVDQRPGSGRVLLSGHSHQAWPDAAWEGQLQAIDDAARLVDGKWEAAFAKAEKVKEEYAWRLGDTRGTYTLGSNTHELLVRFLSGLPLTQRRRLVTTDGEFHTIRRQLDRLEEEGIEVVRVEAAEASTLAERLAAQVDDHTAAVLVSVVLFQTAVIVPGLGRLLEVCRKHGVELLVDAYHAVNAIELDIEAEGLDGAYLVGGGYKYCQLGEGNCFLRVPEGCLARPVITGWFAEFDALAGGRDEGVPYGTGAQRFAGSTYDPTSNYRAAAVFDFFRQQGLAPAALRRISQHQVGYLAKGFDALDLDPRVIRRPARELTSLAGFLALESPRAGELSDELRRRGIFNDYRDDVLRLGPAPYLSDVQLQDGLDVLGEIVKDVAMSTSAATSRGVAPV